MLEKRYLDTLEQDQTEFAAFLDLVRSENVRSYLEIGSKWGGTLWRVANALPVGSKVVAVDLPHGERQTEPSLCACNDRLVQRGYDAHLYRGDSTDSEIVAAVRQHAPFDLCFIDANHTIRYCTKDWENYGPLARIVAFHDIGWQDRPRGRKMPIEVPLLWAKIAPAFPHTEIRNCARDNGIGVLWRQ